MKKISLLVLVIIVFLYLSCERDDICPESTPTSPSLIIDVFDFESQDDSKNVFGLLIAGADRTDILPGYAIVSTDNLVLPLKTSENSTQYSLIKEAVLDTDGVLTSGNEDVITINYSRKEVFVSRACGYKTIYENVTLTVVQDGDNWILSSTPLNPNQSVEDETTAHFNIFH